MSQGKKCVFLLAALVGLAGASTTQAAPLTYSASFSIKLQAGSDVAGLNNSTITFTALYADGSKWISDGFGGKYAGVTSSSITIAGATQPASNGVRSPASAGLLNAVGVDPLWVNNAGGASFPTVTGLAAGQSFLLGLDLNPVLPAAQPLVNDPVKTTHFGTINSVAGFSSFYTTNGAFYIIDTQKPVAGLAVGGPTTPEPTTLTALGAASACLLRRRRA